MLGSRTTQCIVSICARSAHLSRQMSNREIHGTITLRRMCKCWYRARWLFVEYLTAPPPVHISLVRHLFAQSPSPNTDTSRRQLKLHLKTTRHWKKKRDTRTPSAPFSFKVLKRDEPVPTRTIATAVHHASCSNSVRSPMAFKNKSSCTELSSRSRSSSESER